MSRIEFVRDDWMHVAMDHSAAGERQARRFFNATPDAKVEQTKDGYKVWAADCHPGATNDA